jgi:hypothetical protein
MNSASKTWRLRDVAQAAEMNPRALRQCLEIGALELRGQDKKATGSGTRVGLSKPRAYQAAIMKQLNRRGLAIPQAARIAFAFSDAGNVGRSPGTLYEHGRTVIVVDDDGATVKNIFSDTTLNHRSPCTITVDVNKVVEHVDSFLDFQQDR